MDEKRVGVIKIHDNCVDVIGFGILNGTKDILDSDLGITITATKIKLDNGTDYLAKDEIIDDESSIIFKIENYKDKKFIISYL